MSVTFPYPWSGSNGWRCGNCGTWVSDGCTHYCPTSTVRWVNPPPPAPPPTDERIAAALERIAAALDDLAASGQTEETT